MSILCYHSVQPGWSSPLVISPADFAAHCDWLAQRRTVVPLEEAVSLLDRRYQLPRRLSALTFDDGFRGLFEHAFPELVRRRLPATVFLVAETLADAGRAVDWVDDPPQGPLETLSLEQVLEMQEAGVCFGSHSYSHHDLTTLSQADCLADLRRSRELLSELLGRPVPFLAYPRGLHDAGVREAARKAGFSHAFTLPESREPTGCHAVPRVGIYPGNGARGLWVKTRPWYLPIRTSRAFPLLRLAVRGRLPPTRRKG